jgi:type II secretory pathway pseudopilin PulG
MFQSGTFRNAQGFSYVALLVAIVIIGISLGAAGKYWQNVMLRDKEEELLFRGDQYRQAIERYYTAVPGRPQYPRNIDDLLMDERTPNGKRHLRQKYKDPMTGEDFEIITSQSVTIGVPVTAQQMAAAPSIMGVHSRSDKEPLKKDNFPAAYQDFAGKSRYSDWLFVAGTNTTQPPIPGKSPIPGQAPGVPPLAPVSPTIPGQPPVTH